MSLLDYYLRYKRPAWIVAVGVLLFLGLLMLKSSPKLSPAATSYWPVHAISLRRDEYSPTVVLYGKVTSPSHSRLTASLTTHVSHIFVKDGQKVVKGQALIALDARDALHTQAQRQAAVDELAAIVKSQQQRAAADKQLLAHEQKTVSLQKDALDRYQQLFASQQVSQSKLDEMTKLYSQGKQKLVERQHTVDNSENTLVQQTAKWHSAQASLAQAKLDVSRANVVSPFDGVVTDLHVAPAEHVMKGAPLLNVLAIDDLQVRALLPDQNLAVVKQAIHNKQSLIARADLDGHDVVLRLGRLSARVQPGVAGQEVIFNVASGAQLTLGLACKLVLMLPPVDNVFAVPVDALYEGHTVYIIKNHHLRALKVSVKGEINLPDQPQQILISSHALVNGDSVLINQLPNAVNGLAVKVVK